MRDRERLSRANVILQNGFGLESPDLTRFIAELDVGTVNVWEVPGFRIEMSPYDMTLGRIVYRYKA